VAVSVKKARPAVDRGAVVVVANRKGGTGKSLLARCLAECWHKRGRSVMLVDTDPQRGIHRAESGFLPPDCPFETLIADRVGIDQLRARVAAHRDAGAVVVVDTAGFLTEENGAILLDADLVLIPAQPSLDDVYPSLDTTTVIEQLETSAARGGRPLPYRVVLNRVKPRVTLTDVVRQMLVDVNVPVLASKIMERVRFEEIKLAGVPSYGSAAMGDFRALVDEVENVLMSVEGAPWR